MNFPSLIRIKILARLSGQLLDQRFAPLGLNDTKVKTLSALTHHSPLTATELLPWTEVEKASLTGLLLSLEREGLIMREPHPTDGRAVLLSITDKGHEIQKKAIEALKKANEELCSALTSEETEELERLCGLLFARFKEMGIGHHRERRSKDLLHSDRNRKTINDN